MTRYADVDFIGLIERESGISLTRKSNHFQFGDEYAGPCPFCKGGDDRFLVWPNGSRPHFYCRVCNREGSPAQFLMEYADISFGEALALLGLPDSDEQHEYVPPTIGEQMARHNPPSDKWQQAAHILIERAEKYLWHPNSSEGKEALAYLRARGLKDETIKRARLGYVPLQDGRWYKGDFETWGVNPDELREDLKAKGGVRVPNGILIPWLEGKTVWKLCVKRPGEQMSYGQVLGSSDGGLYNIDTIRADQPAMLVESEICSLSVMQEAGDIINCAATGSTPKGRSIRYAPDLAIASYVLQSFDADAAGDEAVEYWLKKLPQVIRWRPWADEWNESGKLRFKDPNDILQDQDAFMQFTGYTLRGWIEQGIWAAQLQPLEDPDTPPEPEKHKSSPQDDNPSETSEKAEFETSESPVLDVFESVSVAHRQTIEERARELHLREPYEPVTLPPLPRKQCPHEVLVEERGYLKCAQCKGKPLAHGWCTEHTLSYDFLCLMASLGYPEVELTFQSGYRDGKPVMGTRAIGAGVANAEAYAECATRERLERDIPRIKARFSGLRLVS